MAHFHRREAAVEPGRNSLLNSKYSRARLSPGTSVWYDKHPYCALQVAFVWPLIFRSYIKYCLLQKNYYHHDLNKCYVILHFKNYCWNGTKFLPGSRVLKRNFKRRWCFRLALTDEKVSAMQTNEKGDFKIEGQKSK